MSQRKNKVKSISDRISELLAPTPLLDPENDLMDETAARTEDYDPEDDQLQIDHRLSEIRKKNAPLLQDVDQKYSGKIASRKDLDMSEDEGSREGTEKSDEGSRKGTENSDEESSDDQSEQVEHKKQGFSMRLKKFEESSEEDADLSAEEEEFDEETGSDDDESDNKDEEENEDDSEAETETDDEESDFDGGDIITKENITIEETNDQQQVKSIKQSDEKSNIKKGVCVQNQLKIWEKLLEVRIHSQKMLIKANSLPYGNTLEALKDNSDEFQKLTSKTIGNVENLLDKMLELQETLVKQYPESNDIHSKKRKAPSFDVTENGSSKYARYENRLQTTFDEYQPFRNEIISKWHDRTKILTPGTKASKSNQYDVITAIRDILMNKEDLRRKSQQVKGTYELFGHKLESEKQNSENNVDSNQINTTYCSEIYDDTDFYHTQLRELIEYKTNATNNLTDMTKQFIELQKLRNKMKKSVDTRASKGRKIRYAIHNKMVNFMAQNNCSTWTDDAKTELYSSLFGARNVS